MQHSYEATRLAIEYPIDPHEVNGKGIFVGSQDHTSGHLRISFEKNHEELIAQKVPGKISSELLLLSEAREKQGTIHGGGMVKIEDGQISVAWETLETAEHRMDTNALANRYSDIISKLSLPQIYSDNPEYSGLFLASPSRQYWGSKTKVMIIGQETKKWRDTDCPFKNRKTFSLEDIEASMDETLEYNSEKARKSRFRQFYRLASKELAGHEQAAVWANQFCISYNKASPVKSPEFERIEQLSANLLKTQFDFLKPDVAIFVTGSARDRHIKSAFGNEIETIKVIEPRRLWHFKIGHTHCFRTNHPRWGKSWAYLNQALELGKNCV